MGASSATEVVEVRPQPGPQELFQHTPADIGIMGGSVFGGKTWSLITIPLAHKDVAGFNFVAFRRLMPEIMNPGGMWDEAGAWYPLFEGEAHIQAREYRFPSGAKGKFAGLQYDADVKDWLGSQICLLLFDQLEEFTEYQFWSLLGRNRSTCGVPPYCRATCNPNPDSFLAVLLAWWIDQETGYAFPEKSGVIRWFIRVDDVIVWASVTCEPNEYTRYDEYVTAAQAELDAKHPGRGKHAQSLTFVLARLQDNAIGIEKDPNYEGRVRAMTLVEQERLLGGDKGGNWKIRAGAGLVFNSRWFHYIDPQEVPTTGVRWGRGWDKAATAGGGDWTWGVKIGICVDGRIIIAHATYGQWAPGERDEEQLAMAKMDGRNVKQYYWQDPGQAGVNDKIATTKLLGGYSVEHMAASGDKVTNAGPLASQAKEGLVYLVRDSSWNPDFVRMMHAFPTKGVPDDCVDACSVAYNKMALGATPRMRSLS